MADHKTPFYVKDCSLAAIATGINAITLMDFRDKIADIHPGCLHFHFWGERLRPQFANPEYHCDFARWAFYGLHEPHLAERLEVIDPTEYADMEALRQAVLDVVDEHLERSEVLFWQKGADRFYFVRSKIVIFDTTHTVNEPTDLKHIIPLLSSGSLFYHFIDAKRRTPQGTDDLTCWLEGYGDTYLPLIRKIRTIDLYFLSLNQFRQRLEQVVLNFFS